MQSRLACAVAASEGLCFDKWLLERPLVQGHMTLEQVRDICIPKESAAADGKPHSFVLHFVQTGCGRFTQEGQASITDAADRHYVLKLPGETWSIRNKGEEPVRVISLYFWAIGGTQQPLRRSWRAIGSYGNANRQR